MALFYAATLFVSACLLFLVQPMIGKMVLPLLGGTPAVWNTCMVVFQALLLAGYTYAHASKPLGVRRQSFLHLGLLATPLLVMGVMVAFFGTPISPIRSLAPQGSEYPFFGVVVLLLVMIGLPFFVVSTSAPLLQSWFSETGHKHASDPYFLYAASNFGSLLALVAYPAIIEPSLPLANQAWLWAGGYVVLVALTAGCAKLLWHTHRSVAPAPKAKPGPGASGRASGSGQLALPDLIAGYPDPARSPTIGQRFRWLALAFVPSSLMLGVTTFASTDIAPIPLLWVIPLGLYLVTFIIAFGRTPGWLPRATEMAAPVFILMMVVSLTSPDLKSRFTLSLLMHLLAFFMIALFCHVELARHRPSAGQLTEFYLYVSLGGVLGGLFNALLAPVAFTGLTEYPIALIAAALLLPPPQERGDRQALLNDFFVPVCIVGFMLLLQYFTSHQHQYPPLSWAENLYNKLLKWAGEGDYNILPSRINALFIYGLPALAAFYFVDRPLRFGLSVMMIWAVGTFTNDRSDLIHQERSFFGILKIEKESETGPEGDDTRYDLHKLVHGQTIHGKQLWNPPSAQPLTYYHKAGPIGQVFETFSGPKQKAEVALIGLGTGSLAAYGQPGMNLTFYEIDWAVRRIAENLEYFTYLKECKADHVNFEMGDARLMLEKSLRPGQYGLIIVDAFSSDAIPVHLLTKEAIALYLEKLAPDGIILLHISNRYLELEPVCARLMREHRLVGLSNYDTDTSPPGKLRSHWIALARRPEDFSTLTNFMRTETEDGRSVERPCWSDLTIPKDAPLWTDDFSNLLQVFIWK